MNRTTLLAFAGASLLALTACSGGKNEAAKDPVTAEKNLAVALRDNDIDRLSHLVVPPDAYAKLEAKWKEDAAKRPAATPAQESQFAEQLKEWQDPDAEAKMFAKVQPNLAKLGPVLPGYVSIGTGMLSQAVANNASLAPDEKTQASGVLTAIESWAKSAHLDDPDKAKQAIHVVVGTVGDMHLTTYDALQHASYPEAMQKAGVAFGGLRKVLGVYGFDTDTSLDGVTVDKVSEDGDNAVVKVSFRVLDAPVTVQRQMLRIDGRWYDKALLDGARKKIGDTAPPVATPSGS